MRQARYPASLPEGTGGVLRGVADTSARSVRRSLQTPKDLARSQSSNRTGDCTQLSRQYLQLSLGANGGLDKIPSSGVLASIILWCAQWEDPYVATT